MTAIYLGELCFPIPPETLTLHQKAGHKRITLCDAGEITQLGNPGQISISFTGFFPPEGSPLLSAGGTPAEKGSALLKGMLSDKKPRLFVAAGVANPLSLQVTAEQLRLWEQAGEPGSVYFALALQEYRQASATVKTAEPAAPVRESARPSPRSYTVVRGDTLWAIARRFLGDGRRYPELASRNNIPNPNLIFPGQVLVIPESTG